MMMHMSTMRLSLDASTENSINVFDTDVKAQTEPRVYTPSTRDYDSHKPYFAWLPTKMIEATFRNSTQYGFMPTSSDGHLFK